MNIVYECLCEGCDRTFACNCGNHVCACGNFHSNDINEQEPIEVGGSSEVGNG